MTNETESSIQALLGEAAHRLEAGQAIRFDDREERLLRGWLRRCLVSPPALDEHRAMLRQLASFGSPHGSATAIVWLERAEDVAAPMAEQIPSRGLDALQDQGHLCAILLGVGTLIDLHERIDKLLSGQEPVAPAMLDYWMDIADEVGREYFKEEGIHDHDVRQIAEKIADELVPSGKNESARELAGMLHTKGDEESEDGPPPEVLEEVRIELPIDRWSPQEDAASLIDPQRIPVLHLRLLRDQAAQTQLELRLLGLPWQRGTILRIRCSSQDGKVLNGEQCDVPGPVNLNWPGDSITAVRCRLNIQHERQVDWAGKGAAINCELTLPEDWSGQVP